jgi:hypothetical protein
MTFGDFKNEIDNVIINRPKSWRKGQAVFNYIESKYGVARSVQFEDGIDCFYRDDQIEEFLQKAYERIKYILSIFVVKNKD